MAAAPELVVSAEDYRYFVERAVRGMAGIIEKLGDGLACVRPELPGANTGYGLLSHCLGVLTYWGGHLIAGRDVIRDRSAEFEAVGTVADLLIKVDQSLHQFELDLAGLLPTAPLRNEPATWSAGPDRPLNQGAAALHIYEEMAQHHGQLQVLRDVLLAGP
ncbi:MAG: DUF664 domain-containing protein [Jatrophihabitantaceae bacterium]